MRHLTLAAIALSLFAFTAAPAFAAKEEHGAAEKKDTGGKIDVADKFGLKRYDLGIYTLIVFGALVFILGKFAWGPMMKGLEKREATMRKHHEDAEASKSEAQKILSEVQARLAKTHDEIRGMLDEARRDAQAVKDQMKADAATEIQAERDRIRRDIEIARDQALQDIYQQSVHLASLVSTKAIKRELTPSDHTRLLDEALTDLKANMGTKT